MKGQLPLHKLSNTLIVWKIHHWTVYQQNRQATSQAIYLWRALPSGSIHRRSRRGPGAAWQTPGHSWPGLPMRGAIWRLHSWLPSLLQPPRRSLSPKPAGLGRWPLHSDVSCSVNPAMLHSQWSTPLGDRLSDACQTFGSCPDRPAEKGPCNQKAVGVDDGWGVPEGAASTAGCSDAAGCAAGASRRL